MLNKFESQLNLDNKKKILLYDKEGNQYSMNFEDWARDLLPSELIKAWNYPERLYEIIVVVLKQEVTRNLIEPVKQLLKIDPNSARSYIVAGIVYLKNNLLVDAEYILKEGINKFPKNGVLLTNLAKVYSYKGEFKLSYDILWQGLTLDPNQDNALNWLGTIHYERGGVFERNTIFCQLAMLPNSWRPQLFLARYNLEIGQFDEAKELYFKVLSIAANEADAIMMITGDLGINGMIDEIFEIAFPFFDLSKHGIKAGMNFIQACIQGKRKETGLEILSDIKKLDRRDFADKIDRFEKQLSEM